MRLHGAAAGGPSTLSVRAAPGTRMVTGARRGRRGRNHALRPPPRLRAGAVCRREAVTALVPELEALADRSAAPATMHPAWLLPPLLADGTDHPLVAVVRDNGGRLRAAVALLVPQTPGGIVTLAGTDGGCRGALLADTAAAAEALGAAVGPVLRARPVALGPLPASHPHVATFARGLPGARVTPAEPIPALSRRRGSSVDAYLPQHVLRTLRKADNRLARDGRRRELVLTSDPQTVADAVPNIERCHRDRDHVQGRASTLDDARARVVWEARIRAHAAQGDLELAMLRIDDVFAAYVLGIARPPVYHVLEGRFVTDFSRYSPGRLLEAAVVQRVLDDASFATVDWMTATAPEKLLAANDLEAMVTIRVDAA